MKNCGSRIGTGVWMLAAGLFFLLIAGCGKDRRLTVGGNEVKFEKVHVTVPGMKGVKTFAFLSDLHIAENPENMTPEEEIAAEARLKYSSNGKVYAKDMWPDWVRFLNAGRYDYVLFGADLLDFASKETVETFGKGLRDLNKPYMYIRADHDIAPLLQGELTEEAAVGLQKTLCDYSDAFTEDFGDFVVFGWNKSTSQITEEGLAKFKETVALGKPVILLTHVPIEPLADESLNDLSKALFSDRELVWGLDTDYYEPDDCTKEFLSIIYSEDSPVKEILCGHLHYSWDGFVAPGVHEHVFSPAFSGFMGIIEVSGE